MENDKVHTLNIKVYKNEKHLSRADLFFVNYFSQAAISAQDIKKAPTPKPKRTCRFCRKHYPETSFIGSTHIIPETLAKNNILSDFECDACNNKFSKYESNLAKYIEHIRTLLGTKGKRGVPNFVPPRGNLEIRHVIDPLPAISIKKTKDADDTFTFNNNQLQLNGLTNEYVPLYVYKALLHVALSVLPNEECRDYQMAFDFLTSDVKVSFTSFPLMMRIYQMDNCVFEGAEVWVFKRSTQDPNLPLHICSIRFLNCSYSFAIPFNVAEYNDHNTELYSAPEIPLFFIGEYPDGIVLREEVKQYNSVIPDRRSFQASVTITGRVKTTKVDSSKNA